VGAPNQVLDRPKVRSEGFRWEKGRAGGGQAQSIRNCFPLASPMIEHGLCQGITSVGSLVARLKPTESALTSPLLLRSTTCRVTYHRICDRCDVEKYHKESIRWSWRQETSEQPTVRKVYNFH